MKGTVRHYQDICVSPHKWKAIAFSGEGELPNYFMDKAILNWKDYKITYQSMKELQDNPSILQGQNDLFVPQKKQAVYVKDITSSFGIWIKKILAFEHLPLVVTTFSRTQLSWIKVFQSREDCLVIPFYEDKRENRKNRLLKMLNENNIQYDFPALELLVNSAITNPYQWDLEVKKCLLYADKRLTLDCVSNLLTKSYSSSVDQFCNGILCKNKKQVIEAFSRLHAEGMAMITLVNYLSYNLIRLVDVLFLIEKGESFSTAQAVLKPPLFFKNKPIFEQAIQVWNSSKVLELLSTLNKCQEKYKGDLSNITPLLLQEIMCFF